MHDGWVHGVGPCACCMRVFVFNPHKVPSYEREPVCGFCMTVINERRKAMGLPIFDVPPDAYEAIPESEL